MKVNKKLSFSGSTVTCEWAFCLYLKIGDPSHSDVHAQSTNKGLWDDFKLHQSTDRQTEEIKNQCSLKMRPVIVRTQSSKDKKSLLHICSVLQITQTNEKAAGMLWWW